MKLTTFLSIFGAIGIIFVGLDAPLADIAMPTETTFYFERDGKPFRSPVEFSVKCLGRIVRPGQQPDENKSYEPPSEIYSFSASCPNYGCKIYEPYYLNYKHIMTCNMEGMAGGDRFEFKNYGQEPIDFSQCSLDGSKAERKDIARVCTVKIELPAPSAASVP